MGCSDRTVRNYQQGLEKKQIVQTKPDYALIQQALAHGITGGGQDIYISEDAAGALKLFEPNGLTNSVREGGHPVTEQRFFSYFGKTWLYRNNIYTIDIQLCNYHFQRQRFKKLMEKK